MLRSLLTLTLRNFFRDASYSFIAMGGLVVGLATVILGSLWVKYELSYDRYDPENERVFVILSNEKVNGVIETWDETATPLMDFLAHGIPEVESATRIDNSSALLVNESKVAQKDGIYVDTGYFNVFNPRIIAGSAANPMPDNHSIAISQELAQMLFENGDAVGKTLSLDRKKDFKVTAVYAQFPDNSSLNYIDFVLPIYTREESEWQNYYIKLNSADSQEAVEKKVDVKFAEFNKNQNTTSLLFCLTDWRLHWSFENGEISGGRIVYVIIFSITALFILVMACVNYMNLATARSAKRAREIGVRKMTGATQPVLVRQFMLESLTLSTAAASISVLAVYLLLPLFNQLISKNLTFSVTDPITIASLLCFTVFTGLLAGAYPALLLSSLKPVTVLKGNLYSALAGSGLRKSLVIFQFTMSVVLIFCAVVMYQQTIYLLSKDLGYDKHNVINIWLRHDIDLPLEGIKAEILAHSAVVATGLGGASPMEVNGTAEVHWRGKPAGEQVLLYGANADEDYLTTLNFSFVQGRNFSPEFVSDSSNFVITEKAAEVLGFENPIGQRIRYDMFSQQEGEIIGVIKDFHNEDIHKPIYPVVFAFGKKADLRNLFIRYEEGKLDAALGHVKAVFDKYYGGVPLNYSFLDKDFENQLFREKLFANLSIWFTVIAIVIACLGLFGLTMFNAQRRTREIGIRKVLGASVSQVVTMLCRDFVRPVALSFLLAFPMAYYIMQRFLEGYAFRISIPSYVFLPVGSAMAGLVLLTVSYQSIKAARRNPVESLKTE